MQWWSGVICHEARQNGARAWPLTSHYPLYQTPVTSHGFRGPTIKATHAESFGDGLHAVHGQITIWESACLKTSGRLNAILSPRRSLDKMSAPAESLPFCQSALYHNSLWHFNVKFMQRASEGFLPIYALPKSVLVNIPPPPPFSSTYRELCRKEWRKCLKRVIPYSQLRRAILAVAQWWPDSGPVS